VYKYFCMSENKSVFNWTFCQLLMQKPNYVKLFILSKFEGVYFCQSPDWIRQIFSRNWSTVLKRLSTVTTSLPSVPFSATATATFFRLVQPRRLRQYFVAAFPIVPSTEIKQILLRLIYTFNFAFNLSMRFVRLPWAKKTHGIWVHFKGSTTFSIMTFSTIDLIVTFNTIDLIVTFNTIDLIVTLSI